MTQRTNQRKANGHAGPHDRANGSGDPDRIGVNGHAPASMERGGDPVRACSGRHLGRAASDDASGISDASAPALAAAAGTDRDTYAAAATPRPNGHLHVPAEIPPNRSKEKKTEKLPGGESPLPANPGEFVEEIHRRIDLFKVWQKLLRSTDPKIKQRAVEKLTEMRYKGAAALAEEPQRIVIDIPRPDRD